MFARQGISAFMLAAACGFATSALAGELDGTVVPVIPSVSLSVGGSQPAASFNVTLTNTSTSSALNTVRLVGTTAVTGGDASAKAVYRSSTAPCTVTNADQTSIDCNIGGLPLGGSATFTITFTSPTSGTKIRFDWQAVFDNGTPPGNSNGDADFAEIGLDPIDTAKVVSDIPSNVAVTFFTGTGVATPTDPWVSILRAPSTAQAVTATVEEGASVSTCSTGPLDCRTTTMAIPSTFGVAGTRPLSQFLEVTILRDASTIARGAKIESAVLYYVHSDTDPPMCTGADLTAFGCVIRSCDDTSQGALPQAGKPCEDRSQRTAYGKKSLPKSPVPAGYEGDWKFIIYLQDNGRITN